MPNENNATSIDFTDGEFIEFFSDEYEEDQLESEWKTISLEEYKKLVDLIPKVEKYRNDAEKKEKIIKLKDSQLKELQRSLKQNWINVSHLSAVSVAVVFECNIFFVL